MRREARPDLPSSSPGGRPQESRFRTGCRTGSRAGWRPGTPRSGRPLGTRRRRRRSRSPGCRAHTAGTACRAVRLTVAAPLRTVSPRRRGRASTRPLARNGVTLRPGSPSIAADPARRHDVVPLAVSPVDRGRVALRARWPPRPVHPDGPGSVDELEDLPRPRPGPGHEPDILDLASQRDQSAVERGGIPFELLGRDRLARELAQRRTGCADKSRGEHSEDRPTPHHVRSEATSTSSGEPSLFGT